MKKKRMFTLTLALAMLLAIFSGTVAHAAPAATSDFSISDAKNAVVRVVAVFDNGESMATGSAFGIGKLGSAPEYFITNAHVCLDENGNIADKLYILLDNRAVRIHENYLDEFYWDINESKTVECVVVNHREISLYPDIAVLKADVPISNRSCLPLAPSSEEIHEAATVYALGYPGNSDYLTISSGDLETTYSILATPGDVNLTSGIISMKTNGELFDGTDVLVHTATISSGNSGGPLIDETGTVVGINTYKLGDFSAQQNVSIYIDYVFDILDSNDIPYVLAGEDDSKGSVSPVLIAGIAAAVVLAAAAGLFLFLKKRRSVSKSVSASNASGHVVRVGNPGASPASVIPATMPADSFDLRLQGVAGCYQGRRFAIENQLTLGRSETCSIPFPANTEGVSSNHCSLSREGNLLYLVDLASTFGTFLNGAKLEPNRKYSVRAGDRISLGSERQSFMVTHKGGKL